MLKIALLGVPGSGKSALAAALADAPRTRNWPATITQINPPTLPPGLASHDRIFLMGLDTGLADSPALDIADQQIRAALAQANQAYQVIYGSIDDKLDAVLKACEALAASGTPGRGNSPPLAGLEPSQKPGQWVWMCEKCSDPVCEHRLLSDLLATRGTH